MDPQIGETLESTSSKICENGRSSEISLDIYVERARERDERETKTERLLSEHFNAFPPPVFNAISNEDETCVQDTFSKSVTVLTVKF